MGAGPHDDDDAHEKTSAMLPAVTFH